MLNICRKQRKRQSYLNIAGKIMLATKIEDLSEDIVRDSCCPNKKTEKMFAPGIWTTYKYVRLATGNKILHSP